MAGCETTETRADRGADAGTPVAAADGAEVYVVAMHADWCATCTRLGPEVKRALGELEGQPLRFVKADLTDRDSPAGEAALRNLGLGKLYEMNKGKTGVVYVVDASDGRVLRRLGGNSDSTMIAAEVRGAIAEAG